MSAHSAMLKRPLKILLLRWLLLFRIWNVNIETFENSSRVEVHGVEVTHMKFFM